MNSQDLFLQDVELIKKEAPLIHNITNFVVMNNTANALLALGASPVMAHAKEEVSEMTSIASALVINIGTLNPEWVEAMKIAGKTALLKGIPLVLDPVGVGATSYRSAICRELIEECKPTIIRGNASEIQALVNDDIKTKGVDSTASTKDALSAAKYLAQQISTIVSVSGEVDLITDGNLVYEVKGGSPLMSQVTGMGCTATAITAAFAAINKNYCEAALHAMQLMSRVGQSAAQKAKGPGSFQVCFLDELYQIEKREARDAK